MNLGLELYSEGWCRVASFGEDAYQFYINYSEDEVYEQIDIKIEQTLRDEEIWI